MLVFRHAALFALLASWAACSSSDESIATGRKRPHSAIANDTTGFAVDAATDIPVLAHLPVQTHAFVRAALEGTALFNNSESLDANTLLYRVYSWTTLNAPPEAKTLVPLITKSLLEAHQVDIAHRMDDGTMMLEDGITAISAESIMIPTLRVILDHCRNTNTLSAIDQMHEIPKMLAEAGMWRALGLMSIYTCNFNAGGLLISHAKPGMHPVVERAISRCISFHTLRRFLVLPVKHDNQEYLTTVFTNEAQRRSMNISQINARREENVRRMINAKQSPGYDFEDQAETLETIMIIDGPSPLHDDLFALARECGFEYQIKVIRAAAAVESAVNYVIMRSSGFATDRHIAQTAFDLFDYDFTDELCFLLEHDPAAALRNVNPETPNNETLGMADEFLYKIFQCGQVDKLSELESISGAWGYFFLAANLVSMSELQNEIDKDTFEFLTTYVIPNALDATAPNAVFDLLAKAQMIVSNGLDMDLNFPRLLATVLTYPGSPGVCHLARNAARDGNWRFFGDLGALRQTGNAEILTVFQSQCKAEALALAANEQTRLAIAAFVP